LFEIRRFTTQNSPAKISRLATTAAEATEHSNRPPVAPMGTDKNISDDQPNPWSRIPPPNQRPLSTPNVRTPSNEKGERRG
jgi:hypothetical protein